MAFCGPAPFYGPVGAGGGRIGCNGFGTQGTAYGGGNFGRSGGSTLNNAGRAQQYNAGACQAANQGGYKHRYTFIDACQEGFNTNGLNRFANGAACMGGQACQSGAVNGFGAIYPSGSYGAVGKNAFGAGGGYGPFNFGAPFGPC